MLRQEHQVSYKTTRNFRLSRCLLRLSALQSALLKGRQTGLPRDDSPETTYVDQGMLQVGRAGSLPPVTHASGIPLTTKHKPSATQTSLRESDSPGKVCHPALALDELRKRPHVYRSQARGQTHKLKPRDLPSDQAEGNISSHPTGPPSRAPHMGQCVAWQGPSWSCSSRYRSMLQKQADAFPATAPRSGPCRNQTRILFRPVRMQHGRPGHPMPYLHKMPEHPVYSRSGRKKTVPAVLSKTFHTRS